MMISRLEIDLTDVPPIESHTTSKGDLQKWYYQNKWYKQDKFGYEGLAEKVISDILQFSSLQKEEFIKYEACNIKIKDNITQGCYSENFTKEDEEIVTFKKIFNFLQFNPDDLNILDVQDRIFYLIDLFKREIGIDIKDYLQKIFTLDAFFLNEDRHYGNLALLYNRSLKKFKPAPIFDNGLSLLSDTQIATGYPLYYPVIDLIKKVPCRPFHCDFEEQLKVLSTGFIINKNQLQRYIENYKEEIGRIAIILQVQMQKYPDIVKSQIVGW